jgi:hypothetical protein
MISLFKTTSRMAASSNRDLSPEPLSRTDIVPIYTTPPLPLRLHDPYRNSQYWTWYAMRHAIICFNPLTFRAYRLLDVPPGLTLKMLRDDYIVFMCFV